MTLRQKTIPTDSMHIKRPIIDAPRQSPIRLGVDSLNFRFRYWPLLNQFWDNRKRLPAFFLLGAVSLSLGGCSGWKWPEWATFDSDPFAFLGSDEESDTPPPPVVIPTNSPDQHAEQPMLMPTSTMGLNLQTYFAQDIKDPVTRIQRLENALVAVHKDLQNISPAAGQPQTPWPYVQPAQAAPGRAQHNAPADLSQNNENWQTLVVTGGPQPLTRAATHTYGQPPHSPPPPATQHPPQTYASQASGRNVDPGPRPPSQFSNGHIFATGIRVGEHSDKVRIVFDVTKQTKFSADLDNGENILVVELPEAGWKAPNHARFPKMPLLESYKIDPFNGGAGSIAVIQLKKSSTILKQQQIPALSGGGKRIYIDLKK